jgi:hypothetical protein
MQMEKNERKEKEMISMKVEQLSLKGMMSNKATKEQIDEINEKFAAVPTMQNLNKVQ